MGRIGSCFEEPCLCEMHVFGGGPRRLAHHPGVQELLVGINVISFLQSQPKLQWHIILLFEGLMYMSFQI